MLARELSPAVLRRWREARYFRRHGEVELGLVEMLCHWDRDAIDVGAHLGAYIHFMRRAARLVYAYEPVPWLAEELRGKFPSRVIIRNLALSNANGTAVLHIPSRQGRLEPSLAKLDRPKEDGAEKWVDFRVERCRLDDHYAGEVGFLKIGVEGHEQEVLQGTRETIDRCRPNILVEIEERFAPGQVMRVRRFFAALGYRGYFLDHGVLREIESFDAASMQRPEDIAGFAAGMERARFSSYINNFIFIHRLERARVLAELDDALWTHAR
jgi:FkbM family methyltransferase